MDCETEHGMEYRMSVLTILVEHIIDLCKNYILNKRGWGGLSYGLPPNK